MKKITSVLLICILVLTGCATNLNGENEEDVIKQVYTETIASTTYSDSLTMSGNIVPIQTVKPSFKIPGVISSIPVREGDFVKSGQVIGTMDEEDYLTQVKAAQAELDAVELQIEREIPAKLNQAKAQYDLTKTSYDRIKALYEQGAVSQSKLDEISAKLIVDENTFNQAKDAKEIAEAKMRKAEAALDLANSQLSDTNIYSPMDGVILKKLAEAGETIAEGYPILVIGQVDQVWVEIGVPDEYINDLQIGQKANIQIYGLDKSVEGVIDEISYLADAETRTFSVRILVDNSNGELKPGMITEVDIPLDSSQKVLIPLSSVLHLSEGLAVYVYSDETKKVSRRLIKTGEIIKDKIHVTEGLDLGEKIVVEGQFLLREGEQVVAEEMTK